MGLPACGLWRVGQLAYDFDRSEPSSPQRLPNPLAASSQTGINRSMDRKRHFFRYPGFSTGSAFI